MGKKKPKLESKNNDGFNKVIFMAYDILSLEGQDLRSNTLKNRKTILGYLNYTKRKIRPSSRKKQSKKISKKISKKLFKKKSNKLLKIKSY